MKVMRALLAVTAAATVPLMPIAAHAETYVQIDFTADVDQAPLPLGGGGSFTAAPDRADGDITSVRISHRAHVVRVKYFFRELARSGPHTYRLYLRSNRLNRRVTLSAGIGDWRGTVTTRTMYGERKRVRCAVRHTTDYVANTVVIKVPRSCLGGPRWVAVSDEAISRTDSLIYVDQGGAGSTEELVYGPRLRRGPRVFSNGPL